MPVLPLRFLFICSPSPNKSCFTEIISKIARHVNCGRIKILGGEIYLVLFVSKKYTLVSRGKKTTFLRKKTRAAKAARQSVEKRPSSES